MENNYFQADFLKQNEKLISFDIEIAKALPDDFGDFKSHRPLGISCAAGVTHDDHVYLWHGGQGQGDFTSSMSVGEVRSMVDQLWKKYQDGYHILTWNGLGFDFDILFEESGGDPRCRQMALDHVDMMFHFFCIKGYALSLEKAANGMGLVGKLEGMDGSLAPNLWKQGEFKKVLDYVVQDAQTTLDIYRAVAREKKLRWTSNRGVPAHCALPDGWLTANDAISLPEPDTSWMRDPWPREKFTGWLAA